MATVRQIADELRRRGVTVHEWPGCEGRGNEGVAYVNAKGGIVHHTGSNYGNAYAGLFRSTRPDLLGGLLCNFAGNEDGSLTLMGTGMAWHAAPASGPSLGALAPYGKSLNRNTVGLEIVYPGTSPMRPAQYRAALMFARVVADLCAGGNIEAIRAHAEASPSGKWDPGYAPDKTIDMAAFRREAATLTAAVEDDLDANQDRMLNEIHQQLVGDNYHRTGKGAWGWLCSDGKMRTLVDMARDGIWGFGRRTENTETMVADMQAKMTAQGELIRQLGGGETVDTDAIAGKVTAAITDSVTSLVVSRVTEVVRTELGQDNADQAERILAKLGEKLQP